MCPCPVDGEDRSATLVQQGQGWFRRQRTGLVWDGALAGALAAAPGLADVLEDEIRLDDGLKVVSEAGLIRIVLARTIVTHLGLAAGADLARIDRPPLSPRLLGAIEQIARVALG